MNLFKTILAAGYDAVTKRNDGRASVPVERNNEDAILPSRKRTQLVATQRDAFRNTTFPVATALQLQVNVVGGEGGKLTLTSPDEVWNERVAKQFKKWSKHCGFSDGICLNSMLQLCLIQLTHNEGDFIAVFDDGILTGGNGSGKIRIFETDEIKPVTEEEFARIYGKNTRYTQSNGLVYDEYQRIVAAFVSSSARDKDEFEQGDYIHLKLATPADYTSSNWILVRNLWRNNQGRGISTSTHVTNLLKDLADTQGSEVQAAKLNSGFGIVVTDENPSADASDASRGFAEEMDAALDDDSDSATDDELAAYDAAEAAALRETSAKLQAGQSAILRLDGTKKIDSFHTERPNLNTVEFIRLQRQEAGTVYGLPPTYVNLEPAGSYTAFRGQMILAEKTFARLRKKLERDFLDWLGVRVITWFGEDIEDLDEYFAWRWPTMAEVDEGSYESAVEKKFTNGTTTLLAIHGANWKRIADQQAEEKRYFEERGLTYPALRTASGNVVEENTNKEAE